MKRILNLLAIILMTTSAMMAQDKKSFTLEDLMPGGNNYFNLQPANLHGLAWWGDLCIKPEMQEVKTINPKNGEESTLFTLEAMNKALEAAGIRPVRALYTLSYPWADKTEVQLPKSQGFAVYNWTTGAVTVRNDLPKEPYANVHLNPVSGHMACTIGNNLYVNGHQVTDEPEGVLCGQAVHRNEFGINGGIFWSPKGNLVAFYRMDQTMVTDYPQVNTSTRIATLEPDKYPMAGMTSHKVTIGVYNPSTKETVYLKAGDPTDRYFTNISWSPDEKSIYVIEVNRGQNHAQLVRYHAATGEKETILHEERHPKYVEPQNPILFLPWDEQKFIYQSQRDGYNHLYLFDMDEEMGISHKQLTRGEWLVQGIVGFNEKEREVIILSTEISPLQSNAYAVNVKNGKRRLIGEGEGVHRVQLSASGKYIIDHYTAHDVPRSISLLPTTGKGKSIGLLKAGSPMEEYNMPEITLGTIKAPMARPTCTIAS